MFGDSFACTCFLHISNAIGPGNYSSSVDIDGGQVVRVAIGFNDDTAILVAESDQTDNALRSFAACVFRDNEALAIGADSDHAERRLRIHYGQIPADGRA